MAVAQESLVIGIDVVDNLSPALQDTKKQIDDFNKTATDQFKKTGAAVDKMGGIADVVTSKFRTLGKAFVGIFAADLIARVAGFSSAMDAVNKAADYAAKSLRELFTGPLDVEAMTRRAAATKKLADEVERISAARAGFNIGLEGGGVSGSINLGNLRGSGRDNAILVVNEALKKIAELDVLAKQAQLSYGLATSYGAANAEQTNPANIRKQIIELIAATQKRVDEANKLGQAEDKVAEIVKGQLVTYSRIVKLQDESSRKAATATGFAGLDALEAERVGRWNAGAAGGAQEAATREANQRLKAALERDREERARRSDRAQILAGNTGAKSGGGDGFFAFSANIAASAIKATKGLASFAGQARTAFNDLRTAVEESLGSQAVDAAFQGFRGFFNDIVTGSASASEAFRNFGLSIVSSMADILAQKFALSALGFFGFDGQSAANGGVFRGGINSFAGGGVAYGPQLAMIGDNRSQTEAVVPMPDGRRIPVEMRGGGGGSTVNMTLNVGSLDPRSAAQVILAQMPAIQSAIASAIIDGSDRNLRVAVRG